MRKFDLPTFLVYIFFSVVMIYWVKSSFMSNIYIIHKRKKYRAFFFIPWLIMTLFAAIRKVSTGGLGGIDAAMYVYQFSTYEGNLWKYLDWNKIKSFNVREPLYYLSIHITRLLTDNYHIWFIFVYGVISAGFLYFIGKTFKRDSVYITVLIPLFNYLHSFNVMRNWAAIALCCVAVVHLSKKREKSFVIYTLLGAGFHYSALVMFVFYGAYKVFNIIKMTRFKLIAVVVIMNAVSIPISIIVASLFSGNKFRFYIGMQSSSLGYITTLFIWVLCLIFYNKLIERDPRNRIFILGLTLNIGYMYLITNMGAYRFNDFFSLFKMVILSECINVVKREYRGQNRKLWMAGLYTFTILYSAQLLFNYIDTSGIMPYVIDGL